MIDRVLRKWVVGVTKRILHPKTVRGKKRKKEGGALLIAKQEEGLLGSP